MQDRGRGRDEKTLERGSCGTDRVTPMSGRGSHFAQDLRVLEQQGHRSSCSSVHHEGRALVWSGHRERAESYCVQAPGGPVSRASDRTGRVVVGSKVFTRRRDGLRREVRNRTNTGAPSWRSAFAERPRRRTRPRSRMARLVVPVPIDPSLDHDNPVLYARAPDRNVHERRIGGPHGRRTVLERRLGVGLAHGPCRSLCARRPKRTGCTPIYSWSPSTRTW